MKPNVELLESHMEEEEKELLSAADKAVGQRPDALYAKMKELFEKTTTGAAAYERAVASGGAAVRSAKARNAVGLYIARGLIEAHGGRLWVESDPGAKTTFHIHLPIP